MKRNLLKIIFSLLGFLLIAVAFSSLSFRQQVNKNPLPNFYKKGAFHIHSNFSDGRGTIAEISRDARDSHLDFVMLTDHGRPNLPASAATGWNNGILLIGASEFSLHEGHLAAAGYQKTSYIFPPEAREALAEVNRERGVSFIAHPFDSMIPWSDWQVRGFTGIEILSLYQLAKKVPFFKATIFPLQYLFNQRYALTQLITYPQKELQAWDALSKEGKYYGIFALDAHAKLQISERFQLNFPSYAAMFEILTVYVKIANDLPNDPQQASAAIIAAIRRGNFFNVIEALAPANGFEHYYRENNGRLIDMGGDASSPGGALIFKLPFAFATDIVVKRDGEIFKTIRASTKQELSIPITQSGVYRAEISLAAGRFKKLPWILANPICVATPVRETKPAEIITGAVLADNENYFQVEKNSRSSAAMHRYAQGKEPAVIGLTFTLQPEAQGQPNFWVALAHRQKLAAIGQQHGFVFEARASVPMHFWLQFRNRSGRAESAYQHSFLADGEWRQVAIPFSAFHQLYGQPAPVDPANINSFFFLIDNGLAYPGVSGEIFFRHIGLY